MSNQFINTKQSGLISDNEITTPQLLTFNSCSDFSLTFIFQEKTGIPVQLGNTTRVEFCRTIPKDYQVKILSASFKIYDEICCGGKWFVNKIDGDGIDLIESENNENLHSGLKVNFSRNDFVSIPQELAWSLEIDIEGVGLGVWSYGSVLIRPCPPEQSN